MFTPFALIEGCFSCARMLMNSLSLFKGFYRERERFQDNKEYILGKTFGIRYEGELSEFRNV